MTITFDDAKKLVSEIDEKIELSENELNKKCKEEIEKFKDFRKNLLEETGLSEQENSSVLRKKQESALAVLKEISKSTSELKAQKADKLAEAVRTEGLSLLLDEESAAVIYSNVFLKEADALRDALSEISADTPFVDLRPHAGANMEKAPERFHEGVRLHSKSSIATLRIPEGASAEDVDKATQFLESVIPVALTVSPKSVVAVAEREYPENQTDYSSFGTFFTREESGRYLLRSSEGVKRQGAYQVFGTLSEIVAKSADVHTYEYVSPRTAELYKKNGGQRGY